MIERETTAGRSSNWVQFSLVHVWNPDKGKHPSLVGRAIRQPSLREKMSGTTLRRLVKKWSVGRTVDWEAEVAEVALRKVDKRKRIGQQ